MRKRTYLDASVLIAAFRGTQDVAQRAMEVLDDEARQLVTSDALWLEVMPKPLCHGRKEEAAAYEAVFASAEHHRWQLDVLDEAKDLAPRYGLAAMDAIHVAVAFHAKVDELVTCEKATKPFFSVQGLVVRSLLSPTE